MVLYIVSHHSMSSGRTKRDSVPWFNTESLGKEFKDLCTLISLKLYDFAQILTFNNSSVACEIFFESL